jgi:glycosyltransferase involved in cell wall biosynthesis
MPLADYILDARTATDHFPGIGRYIRNLTTALVPLLTPDERLTILWQPSNSTAWNPNLLAGPQVTITPAPAPPFSLAQQWQIPRLLRHIRKQQSDSNHLIYHSSYYLMPYWPGLPTVLTIYDLIALMHSKTVSSRARIFFRLATQLALNAAGQVITISKATHQDLLRHFPTSASKITIIPLAADRHFQPQSTAAIQRVLHKYQLPQRYILYLGINKPHKNLAALVEAYSGLNESRFQTSLVIAGAWDPRYPEPKVLVQALGLEEHVHFLGPVDDADLPALYSGCSLFVFPSLYEGFGLPVLEAMACGAPVACSSSSSLPEIAGDAAILFEPNHVEEITAAMHRAIDDENFRQSLGQRSLQQAQHFSWARTAQQTLSIYRSTT